MTKRPIIFVVCLILAAAVFGVWYFRKAPSNISTNQTTSIKPHLYKDPSVDISQIDLKIFYVVPNNLQVAPEWRTQISSILTDIVKFHELQFHNTSKLTANLYPSPVILTHEDSFYDTQNTDYGNPQGLRNIVPELESRFPDFLKVPPGNYQATAIIYEGVGASGAENAMILSRTFLSGGEYNLDGASLFYHEFAHTFGVPDRYDLTNNQPESGDIMGNGRFKPLDTNYLGSDILKDLGVIK